MENIVQALISIALAITGRTEKAVSKRTGSATVTVTNTTGTKTILSMPDQEINRGAEQVTDGIKITRAGLYLVVGYLYATDNRNLVGIIDLNGNTRIFLSFKATAGTNGYQCATASDVLYLSEGDVLKLAYENRDLATSITSRRLSVVEL